MTIWSWRSHRWVQGGGVTDVPSLRRVRSEQLNIILLGPEGRHPHPREGVPQLRSSHC